MKIGSISRYANRLLLAAGFGASASIVALSHADPIPDMCVTAVDPAETKFSASSASGYLTLQSEDSSQHSQMYSQIIVEGKICATLTSSSKEVWDRIGKAAGFNNAGLFAGELTVTGNAANVTFPHLYPYSYAWDSSKSAYDTKSDGRYSLPWQIGTQGYKVVYTNKTSQTADIKVAGLMGEITDKILAVNPGSAVMSAATSQYVALATSVIDRTATTLLTQGVKSDQLSTDVGFEAGSKSSAGLIIRLRDNKKVPTQYAAVKVSVAFRSSLVDDKLDTETKDGVTRKFFKSYPSVVDSIRATGPTGAPLTLRELLLVSKSDAYLFLVKANSKTDLGTYHDKCEELRTQFSTLYGLNSFDTALAMGDVLRSTNYVRSSELSGTDAACVNQGDKDVLSSVGLAIK